MSRRLGTVSRGVRCPIIKEGDDLVSIVTDSIILASEEENFPLNDRDVVAISNIITKQICNSFKRYRKRCKENRFNVKLSF